MKNLPSLATCRNLFDFNPETGKFFWKFRSEAGKHWNACNAGKPTFTSKDKDGYLVAKFLNPDTGKKERHCASRIAWLMATGVAPECIVDHRNHIRNDNRFENLRLATDHQNKMNTTKNHGSSKYQGVHFHRQAGKWCAMKSGKTGKKYIGLFDTEEDAARARDAAVLAAYGEFAKLNFPPSGTGTTSGPHVQSALVET